MHSKVSTTTIVNSGFCFFPFIKASVSAKMNLKNVKISTFWNCCKRMPPFHLSHKYCVNWHLRNKWSVVYSSRPHKLHSFEDIGTNLCKLLDTGKTFDNILQMNILCLSWSLEIHSKFLTGSELLELELTFDNKR